MSLEHILLGLLREPASGYDLKNIFDLSVRYFWAAELSQIYPTLRRLEQDGLLQSETLASNKGPNRKVYSITAAGKEVLREWVTGAPRLSEERYGFVAQLFFMDAAGDLKVTLEFVRELRDTLAERLKTYEHIERAWLEGGGHFPDVRTDAGFHEFMALRGGKYHMKARLEWCDELIACVAERMREERQATRE